MFGANILSPGSTISLVISITGFIAFSHDEKLLLNEERLLSCTGMLEFHN